jgi:adenylate cyclase
MATEPSANVSADSVSVTARAALSGWASLWKAFRGRGSIEATTGPDHRLNMNEPEQSGNQPSADERWRYMLTTPTQIGWKRRLRARIPSSPRCKLCAAPFAGPGKLVMELTGHAQWAKNPKYCGGCFRTLRENHGGAEIECSLLFADVRGSTTLAEGMSPSAFNRLMGRFYDRAVDVLTNHDAFVDKFVGDEIIGIFVPALAGERHAGRALDAATALMQATGHGAGNEPWVPIGIGVNTGVAYVGSIGQGQDVEMTAMGDVVNTTARLASAAKAGEILLGMAAATSAGVSADRGERRSLTLKGKSESTEVLALRP